MSSNQMDNEYIFTYDREEIREIYDKLRKGISIPMNKALKEDIKQYVKLLNTISEDDDDDELAGLTKEERINHIMERHKREATKSDVALLELSDKQKAEIRKGMETSIVRPNPKLMYHKLDEELYDNAEKKEIYTALGRVDKCYYNQQDYVNAINVIMKAIKYSLEHDYPWMSKEEAYDAFNRGEIKFTYKQIPVLYTGWNKIIEDPKILAGIVTGRIDIIDEQDRKRKKKQVVIPEGVSNYEHDDIKVDTIGPNEYNRQYSMHQRGIDNPLSPVIRAEIGTYSRFSLPTNNYFFKAKEQANRQPVVFDWLQDDAGEKYYDIINNTDKDNISNIIDCVYNANNGDIKTNMQGDIEDFLDHLRHPERNNTQYMLYDNTLVQTIDPNTVALEQSILQQMRNSNPNI